MLLPFDPVSAECAAAHCAMAGPRRPR